MNRSTISESAAALHRRALVLDMTMPMLQGSDLTRFWAALDRMRQSGYSYVSLTIAADHTGTWETFRNIALLRTLLARRRWIRFVNGAQDVRRAKAEGKLAVGMNFQGTVPIGRRLGLIRTFYRLGVRHMLMAYNTKNLVGFGCHDAADEGLTPFGRAVIGEMNRVGMLVDVAHTGYRTSMETIEASLAPVVVSHGNVQAVHQHPRCYRDDQIRAVAATGGVFGVTGFGLFLGSDGASVDQFVRHVDHIVQLVGPQHVGFGSDYVYDMPAFQTYAAAEAAKFPEDSGYHGTSLTQLEIEQTPSITGALLKMGYSEDDVTGFLGGNWMRVLDQVWR
ncbi:MAG TPA: membrane dipeptidase [Anaerolineae bacterium]|nr:membrane dipeptidase [Anaerolineae bacterium]